MKKALLAVVVAACSFALQGCSGGDITAQQQHDKKAELQKVADESGEPKPAPRPQ